MDHNPLKIVVVGGVAGGASAAAKARRVDEHAEIVIFEKGPYVSFANCGLPYHLSGEIENRDDLFVVTPERMKNRYNIEVRTGHEVIAIDRENKTISVKNLEKGDTYHESYDTLVLAPGANAVVPPIEGIDAKGVFYLKTISDMDGIIAYKNAHSPENATVIGGGFIGLEAAEALHKQVSEVSVVEATNQILPPWDPDMADWVEQHMLNVMWVDIYKGDPVKEINTEDGRVCGVTLESGETIDTELVILAVGLEPATELAAEAGLNLSPRGLILTDEHMRTSDRNIFAAGDAVQTLHRVSKDPTWLPLAGPANRQGRVAGANAAGATARFPGVIGTSVVRVGKMIAARTGLNEKEAKAAQFEYFSSISAGKSHADYYPGADDIQVKLIAQKTTGRLLGAQVVGRSGVDKRIDVLATAITAKMTVSDLVDIELAYAPPFGSAKDPINIAAMVAESRMNPGATSITWDEVMSLDPKPLLLDVRSDEERKTVYIRNSEHIDIDTLRDRLGDIDPNAEICIYCRIGLRGYLAEKTLKGNFFKNVKSIAGGWRSIWGELRDEELIGEEPEPEDM